MAWMRLQELCSVVMLLCSILQDSHSVPLALYKNGLMWWRGPFRPFDDEATLACVADLENGRFPQELLAQYPDGCHVAVTDLRDTTFCVDQRKEAFPGEGHTIGQSPGAPPPSGARSSRISTSDKSSQEKVTSVPPGKTDRLASAALHRHDYFYMCFPPFRVCCLPGSMHTNLGIICTRNGYAVPYEGLQTSDYSSDHLSVVLCFQYWIYMQTQPCVRQTHGEASFSFFLISVNDSMHMQERFALNHSIILCMVCALDSGGYMSKERFLSRLPTSVVRRGKIIDIRSDIQKMLDGVRRELWSSAWFASILLTLDDFIETFILLLLSRSWRLLA